MNFAMPAIKALLPIGGGSPQNIRTFARAHIDEGPEKKRSSKGTLTGRITFDDRGPDGKRMPDADEEILIYTRGLFGKKLIARTKTDKDGKFSVSYTKKPRFFENSKRFKVKLVEPARPFSVNHSKKTQEKVLQTFTFKVPKKADSAHVSLDTDYANHSKDLTTIRKPTVTHWQSLSYYIRLVKAALPEVLKAIFVSVFQRWLTASQVQKIYDSFGKKYPKVELTADNLIAMLLNGIGNVGYEKVDDEYVFTAAWGDREFDRERSLPDVQVFAYLDSTNKLQVDRISVKFREDDEAEIIKPDNKKEFNRALYIAMTAFSLKGEAEHHLGEGHILPLNIAIPFFKFITKSNPLYSIIGPHLDELHFIDFFGSLRIIFGKGSSLDESGLAPKGIADDIIDSVHAKSNWKEDIHNLENYKAINDQDLFEPTRKVHQRILTAFYSDYIAKKLDGIKSHWDEVYKWSEAIHSHLPNCPRVTENIDSPSDTDLQNLAAFLAWTVSKTTLIHSTMHLDQEKMANIHVIGLGMQNACQDVFGRPVKDGNMTVKSTSTQLLIVRTLLNMRIGKFTQNSHHQYPREVVEFYKKHHHLYPKLPHLEKMMGSTSI